MCGISGIIDVHRIQNEGARSDLVKKMNAALVHRGPDSEGFYSDSRASLAMRRLSIIDTEGGNQPIFNENKTVLVFLNGEIYNYKRLTKKLKSKGHLFSTSSDTEVLVHLYERYGEKMLHQLKGMFSFCLYDIPKKKWILARDRFGEKPLYYHFEHNVLSFSSEITSLLENTWIMRKLDHETLTYFLRTATIPEPFTLFKDVQSLCPGHFLVCDDSGLKTVAYYRPEKQGARFLESESEAIDFIETRLKKAVKRQMVSDVPIGAFLSGGIDSSTVVALMQEQSDLPIQTFNVKFEAQEYDESEIARKVAEHCGTDHHEIVVANYDFDEKLFWEIIDHVGMPFRDTSAIPTYLISREISKYVKVALSGDGGDELFGGYDIFQWYLKIRNVQRIPRVLRGITADAAKVLPKIPGLRNSSKVRRFIRGMSTSMVSQEMLPVALSEMFKEDEVERLLRRKSDYALYRPFVQSPNDISPLRNIMYYRLMHVLPVNMLVKVDRMSMAHGLEVRAPFLDIDLFTASMEIPDHLMIKDGQGKYLIRSLMRDRLPAEVFEHKKQGFNLPLHHYMNDNFRNLAVDLLFENNPWEGFIDKSHLQAIFDRGLGTKQNSALHSVFQASHQLWMMMQLLGWARRFKVDVR